jgi:hypothetical protein
MAKVEHRENGRWFWTAARYANGYSMFGLNGRPVYGHRWAYEHFVGEIPDGLVIDHTCHTRACAGGTSCPHRRCVNPAHLEAVTQKVNIARGQTAQSHATKTHCIRGHELTESNIYLSGRKRQCRTCRAIRRRERRARVSGLIEVAAA